MRYQGSPNQRELPVTLEDDILTALVTHTDLAALIVNYGITPDKFPTKAHKQIAKVAIDFYHKWHRPIGIPELRNQFDGYRGDNYAFLHRIVDEKIPENAPNITADRDILEDKLRCWVASRRTSEVLTNAYDNLEAGQLEKALEAKSLLGDIEREFYQPKELPNLHDLMLEDLPPVQYLVNGVIPRGLTIIAGSPKIGKSWLALDMAIAATSNGKVFGEQTQQCGALYLALEDNKRRLHRRSKALLNKEEPSVADALRRRKQLCGLHYQLAAPTLDHGLIGQLDRALERYPDIGLIVIDTLEYIRGDKAKGEDDYKNDCKTLRQLKQLMDNHPDLSIVVVHHTTKAKGDNGLQAVRGTYGITGTADTIIVFTSAATGKDNKLARLQIDGRDVEDTLDKLVELGDDPPRWRVLNDDYFEANTAEKRDTINDLIIDILRKNDGPMDTPGIARALEAIKGTDLKRTTIDAYLSKLLHRPNSPITRLRPGVWDLKNREPTRRQEDQPETQRGFFH